MVEFRSVLPFLWDGVAVRQIKSRNMNHGNILQYQIFDHRYRRRINREL